MSIEKKRLKAICRVAAYCRVSTLAEEQSDSYETQCAYYRWYVEADPTLTLADVYGDHGVSGLSANKRPEFCRMMRDCMDGKIDLVMTKSVSRFARNLADCMDCVRKLREKGIPVIFEKEGLCSTDPSCELLLSLLATMAQEESNNLSQHIRWSYEQRNAVGDPAHRARYGYRRAADANGRSAWTIYEPEAKRVRLAFDMASAGKKYAEIRAALNRLEERDKTGLVWTQTRLHNLLISETYQGDILTNKSYRPDFLSRKVRRNRGQRTQYYIEDHHEGIVSREQFNTVTQLLKEDMPWMPRRAKGDRT